MNIDEIRTLTDLMVNNDLAEIMIRDGEKRIIIRRGPSGKNVVHPPALATHVTTGGHSAGTAPPVVQAADDPALATIKSPMVGTFYSSPAPDAAPFVKLGEKVNPDTIVCIIEAMKVFNEIKADVAGTIEAIEISSGAPVEYGQVLMRVRTA